MLFFFFYTGALALIGTTFFLWRYFSVPSTIPFNIPRTPVWVNFYAWYHDLSVPELYDAFYRKPMETHGAIAVWFTGKWCISTSKPEYVVDIFRNDDTWPKKGANVRGRGNIMAEFVGENIINCSKPTWNTLTTVMRPGFLKNFDTGKIHEKARKVPVRFLEAQRELRRGRGVDVATWMEKIAQDVMGLCLFDFDLQALDEPQVPYAPLLGQVLPAIFSRWAMYFPKLDTPGRHLFSRARTLTNMAEFDKLLDGMVEATTTTETKQRPKVVSQMLKKAFVEGKITYAQYRANLRMSFMFGHDTTAIFLGLIMYVLGKDRGLQDLLRAECMAATAENVNDLPYLTSLLYEVLRVYPPVTEMLNHTAAHPAKLGGDITVHPGTWIGWNSYGVHTNPAIWGADAKEIRPERWGSTVKDIQANFRLRNTKGHYIPFSMHSRKCLGQSLVLTEVRLVMFEMVRRVKWVVDPTYKLNLGGIMFMMPLGLRVLVEELEGGSNDLEKV
ncbi:cytochrome P450 [Aspergillus stella-maris]|uniref:cytochrome P450 n=1 Tax=Aspergillus stella-maris TaxID=1810926 RepID=UPI003CCD0B7F